MDKDNLYRQELDRNIYEYCDARDYQITGEIYDLFNNLDFTEFSDEKDLRTEEFYNTISYYIAVYRNKKREEQIKNSKNAPHPFKLF